MSKNAGKKSNDSNTTININIFSNITVDGKSLICCIDSLIISFIALVVFIRDPEAYADIVRFLISMASNC